MISTSTIFFPHEIQKEGEVGWQCHHRSQVLIKQQGRDLGLLVLMNCRHGMYEDGGRGGVLYEHDEEEDWIGSLVGLGPRVASHDDQDPEEGEDDESTGDD